jgi:multidrug efflux system membrane fusion protein
MQKACLIALPILALLAACDEPPPPREIVRPVRSVVVALEASRAQVHYAGEVRSRYETALAFRVPGKLVARLVDVGDTVRAGQALARIDSFDLAQQAAAARGVAEAARTEMQLAESDLARYRELREKNFISQAQLDRHSAEFDAARARLRSTGAQLNQAQNQLGYGVLSADHAGVVATVEAEAGQVLAAGQTVLRVSRPDSLEIEISVPEQQADEVRTAPGFDIKLWAAPERGYHGRLREIAPATDPVTRTYRARITVVDADTSMRLGMTAEARLSVPDDADAVFLPISALHHQDNAPAVWVVDGSARVRLRQIAVDQMRDGRMRVTSGLQAGERVVTAGVQLLTPGQQVRVSP